MILVCDIFWKKKKKKKKKEIKVTCQAGQVDIRDNFLSYAS